MAQLGVKSDAPLLCGSGTAVSWRRAVAAAAMAGGGGSAVAAAAAVLSSGDSVPS